MHGDCGRVFREFDKNGTKDPGRQRLRFRRRFRLRLRRRLCLRPRLQLYLRALRMRGVVRRHVCEVVAVLLELMCIILMDIMFPALMCMGVKLKVLFSLTL